MKYVKYIVICLILLFFTGAILVFNNKKKNNVSDDTDTVIVDEKKIFIENKINEMSIDEKIGQMLMLYDYSEKMNNDLSEEIKEVQPGGFIVFAPNMTTYDDTKKLINDISSLTDIPMFIAVDEEGGIVQRLKSLDDVKVTDIPDMRTLGKTKDENLAYEVGRIIGLEVSTLGINTVFGPVLDVGPNTSSLSNRIISSNKESVKNLGLKIGMGIENTNVLAVYKHFPGIGNSSIDSHLALPVIKATKEELYENELIPFKASLENASMIMVGHAAYPKVTGSNIPASLSSVIINDLLRGELGYNGVVITDALNMKAVTNSYSEKKIYEMAINAGVDILLMPKDSKKTIKIVKELIDEGKVSIDQINNSVRRILTLKYYKLDSFVVRDKSYLAMDSSLKIVNEIKNYDSN